MSAPTPANLARAESICRFSPCNPVPDIAEALDAAEQRAEARIVTFLRAGKGALVHDAALGWALAADMIERRKHMESA